MAPPLFFHLVTQRNSLDVEGWYPERMGMALGVVFCGSRLKVFAETDLPELMATLAGAERVVGWNLVGFDFVVLSGYPDFRVNTVNYLDLLLEVEAKTGRRVQLDSLVGATLKTEPIPDGLSGVDLYKSGRIDRVVENCANTVMAIKELHQHGVQHGYVLCSPTEGGASLRIEVPEWQTVPQAVSSSVRSDRSSGTLNVYQEGSLFYLRQKKNLPESDPGEV